MSSYIHDGVVFDLSIAYRDCTNVEWEWSGNWSLTGEPMMRERGQDAVRRAEVSLPDLYHYHGPLIPMNGRPTDSQFRAAVDPDYADTLASGYVESPAEFGRRIAVPESVLPTVPTVPMVPGRVLAPRLMEQRGFRAFLRSLRGGA
ncbi:phiSA1p31-related protein [Streptomyces sp. NPDC059783]|uniref:phiSA1p31-related protein n=1 Tax=Streptomyces sp. NPDC059783 TaxID=3346944 RepID=UPI003654279A